MADLETEPSEVGSRLAKSIQFRDLASVESALTGSILRDWDEVARLDPTSTLFQTPMWAMPWYRAYDSAFQPLVLAVTDGQQLTGVVPLAVERRTGKLVFAGDNMADYRDVIARPGHRREVLHEFLTFFETGFPNMLWLGPNLPESETVATVLSLKDSHPTPILRRVHLGWRWWASERDRVEDPLKKKAVRYALNFFKRQGPVEVKTIDTIADWDAFKNEFFRQHSLRQLFGGRPVSFDNPLKRAFFDKLFLQPCKHVTALYVNGRMVSSHVGSSYRDVLLWGAPSFDVRESAYSPGLLLTVLTMQQAQSWGFIGFDLTIGEGDMKERFSTSRVELPSVELYPSHGQYWISKIRTGALTYLRNQVGEETWTKRWKPAFKKVTARAERARELGFAGIVRTLARKIVRSIGESATGLVLVATPETKQTVRPALKPGEICVFHENEIFDLLKWSGEPGDTARQISTKAREFAGLVKSGRTFHTVLVDDRLAGWGLSYWPDQPALLSETGGTRLDFEPESVSLYDFFILPEFRGRKLYQALLSHIMDLRFAEGAKRAYIGVLESNASSLAGIERAGFRRKKENRYLRLFRWCRTVSRDL